MWLMSIDWYRLLIVSNQDLRASEEQEEQQQHKNQQQEEEGVEEGGDEGGEEGGEHGGEHGEQEEREEGEEKELGEGLPPIPLTALGKVSVYDTFVERPSSTKLTVCRFPRPIPVAR